MKYNHMFTVAFEVESLQATGLDVTPLMFQTALLKRMAALTDNDEWSEATGAPDDTYEVKP